MSSNPRSTFKIAGHPIHPILVTLPIGFWIGAFLTDVMYWQGGWSGWAYFSEWLIGAGLAGALLAAIAGFTDFMGDARIRAIRKAWYHLFGNLLAVVLQVANFVVHMRDGAMAVLPTGLILSTVVVLLLLFNGWMGGELVFRGRVGVHDAPEQ